LQKKDTKLSQNIVGGGEKKIGIDLETKKGRERGVKEKNKKKKRRLKMANRASKQQNPKKAG